MESHEPTTITTQVPGYYKCGHCALHFKTRARFRAHEATCLSLKQIRARATFAPDHAAPSIADLFALVQQLAVRLETAEHELIVLKRHHHHQKPSEIHRNNLLEWLNDEAARRNGDARLNDEARLNGEAARLNDNARLLPFSAWLPAIPPINREHLELVFQHGFIDGVCAIVASSIASDNTAPLRAYDEAPGLLVVYETDPTDPESQTIKWRPITHSEFEQFINRMQKLVMNEFVSWQQEHKERWHDPDFAQQYDANMLKVMGSGKGKSGGCSNRDMLMTRLKPKVYAAIKRSANNTCNDE